MGRYYTGDIEGKFWFGVQSSDDGEFFGASPTSIDYFVDDLEKVRDGIDECLETLGQNKELLDEFFKLHNGYNYEMLTEFYKERGIDTTREDLKEFLVWYARLELGKQIYDCVHEQERCSFTAEL